MEFLFIVLVLLFVLLLTALFALIVAAILWMLRKLWKKTEPDQTLYRVLIVTLGLILFVSPYIAWTIYEHKRVLARVPAPLEVASIEYRLEEGGGIGPGANETGFVVYRLTEASTQWTREQGAQLGEQLPGGSKKWRQTPVDDVTDHEDWHPNDDNPEMGLSRGPLPHKPTVSEFLDKYGRSIPIENGRLDEVDRAIQSPDSFYSKGEGGSVTVVDPGRGKVYFFYAG